MDTEISREVLFARSLEKIRRTAREQGNCITEDQVRQELSALNLNEGQLQMVYDYLAKHRVGIGAPPEPEEYLTAQERDYLQDYLDELAALPEVTEGEREAYTISAMAGDALAKQRLTESYLKEVAGIARLYSGQGVALEDLIGEGNVALAVGVDMLGSLEKPSQAQGMLVKYVMDAMEVFIQEHAAREKADNGVADKVTRGADKARERADELRRKVTPGELGQETGMSVKAIRDAMRMSGFQIEDIEGQDEQDNL